MALELPERRADDIGLLAEEGKVVSGQVDAEQTSGDLAGAPLPASSGARPLRRLTTPWLPDGDRAVKSRIRLAKFLALSWVLVVCGHAFIRSHKSERRWERDPNYSLGDFHSLDLHACALDALCFFVVGRWWRRRGVDRWNVFAPLVSGLCLFSAVGAVDVAHQSISLFAIKCVWPASVVAAATLLTVVILLVVVLHVRAAWRDGLLLGRCVEIAATFLVFVLPVFRDPSFHLHHWYWTWLIGMHANQDAWWSQAASAFLWGGYLNGIAGHGVETVTAPHQVPTAPIVSGRFPRRRRMAATTCSAVSDRSTPPRINIVGSSRCVEIKECVRL